ncbi:MAG TPA: hypothetical protein VEA38_21260 [Terriglobales bacterium]|nr:hypothetical protein [Terriglobales bacterium]
MGTAAREPERTQRLNTIYAWSCLLERAEADAALKARALARIRENAERLLQCTEYA